MIEVAYKPWENDSQHAVYDTANQRRIALFEEKIEGLQVKVKRTSEGKFIVKTRIPVPPKPAVKKKTPAKKTVSKKASTKRAATKKDTQPVVESPAPKASTPTKKRVAKKTSRKRK